jgi:UPF0755 protein
MIRRLGCIGTVAVLALVLAAALFFKVWIAPGPADKDIMISVAQGSSLTSAARALEKDGAIGSATTFVRLAKFLGTGTAIKPGEYRVKAHQSLRSILAMLQSGKTFQRFINIPEGMPSVMVRDRLMANADLTGDIPVPEEGSILPDSYAYQKGDSRAAVLKHMQDAMTKLLAELWPARKPTTVVTNVHDALTLASIVEKETALPEERRTVAGVYSNRLREGMKLQADPTIIYPVTRGRPLGRRILKSEKDAVNDYNTYSMTGLPIGPVANPGRAAIEAVLDPEQTSAHYFVANGKGGHVFADTLQQHDANVTQWKAIRHARGEM